jgi:heavy metal translocating P-type ATPase
MTQIADRKPPIELLADKLMNYYGPVVFIVAAIAFLGWLAVTGQVVASTLVLLTVVIMGYPCALGITTPMLAAIAGGRGIAIGLLVKASEVFHELSITDTVVFDKTGTLTYGRPTVTDAVAIRIEQAELLALAGAIESPSEHPLGQAIRKYVEFEGVAIPSVKNFRAIPGKGVTGELDGVEIIGGKPSFLEERGVRLGEGGLLKIKTLSAQGKTVVLFAKGGELAGMLALQDTPRKGAKRAVELLKAKGMKTFMLTGDSRPVAEAIGRLLGIDEIRAELLPADKVAAIVALQEQGRKVAMVGDGINDAPALAQADVGIAIAAGTDVAIESAGVILVSDRIEDVAGAFTLGKASYRTMTGNVIVAVLFNVAGMILAALGWITPLYAIGFMILSIFAILLNTLRIRAIKLRDDVGLEENKIPVSEIELLVPKMVCEGCAQKISETLSPIAGIKNVKSKIPQKHVIVSFDPKTIGEDQIKKALDDAGYTTLEA